MKMNCLVNHGYQNKYGNYFSKLSLHLQLKKLEKKLVEKLFIKAILTISSSFKIIILFTIHDFNY